MILNILRKFLIFFLYFILCIYSLEFLSYFFLKKDKDFAEKSFEQVKKEIFIKNKSFDQRNDYQAFYEENIKNNVQPSFKLSQNNISVNDHNNILSNFLTYKIENGYKIPFRGPKNMLSLGSNEEGVREVIHNDYLGFKNFNSNYKKEIDIIIVGDPLLKACLLVTNIQLQNLLTEKNLNSLNFGFSGAGPLGSLGIIREYGSVFKPKHTFYLYYEGNDLLDLSYEKKTFLIKYLDEFYSQNLYNSKKEVTNFLTEYNELFFKILPSKIIQEKKITEKNKFNEKKVFTEKLKDFLELQNLKEIIPKDVYYLKNEKVDYLLFEKIINLMKKDVSKWSGNFTIIYLPSFTRYNKNFSITDFLKKEKFKK